MKFSDNNYIIKKVREKITQPLYLKEYKKYLMDPYRRPADGTIKQFLFKLEALDRWLKKKAKLRAQYNGTWDTVKEHGLILAMGQDNLEGYFRDLFNGDKTVAYRRSIQAAIKSYMKFVDYTRTHPSKFQCSDFVSTINFVPNWTHVDFKKTFAEKTRKPKDYLNEKLIAKLRKGLYSIQSATPNMRLKRIRNIALFELLMTTGMRKGELASIEVKNIDLEKKRIHIFGQKTAQIKNGWRFVPLQRSTADAITLYMDEYKHQFGATSMHYLFSDLKSSYGTRTPIKVHTITNAVVSWSKYIDPVRTHPHLFRHYFATKITQELGVHDAAQIIGDEIHTVIKRYYHPDSKDSVNKLIDMEFAL